MFKLLFFILLLPISFALEKFHKPRAGLLSAKAIITHSVLFIFITIVFLILTQRFYMSVIGSLACFATATVVSQAKYNLLREPLIYYDLSLFLELIRFPRLFLPFAGKLLIVGLVLSPLLITACILMEPKWLLISNDFFIRELIYLLALSLFWQLARVLTKGAALSLNPEQDIKHYGLLGSFVYYYFIGLEKRSNLTKTIGRQTINKNLPSKPHIVVVQSESFFDARQLSTNIKKEVLSNFDNICQQSIYHGKLVPPAWGAYTLRTEFSFLTAVHNKDLEHGKFHPYNYFKDKQILTLASELRQQGYRCICIHPYYKKFFNRDKIYSSFGFDEFIDIENFDGDATCGTYISDKSLTKKITEQLDLATQPTFIFAITMENHGPYHLEKLDKQTRDKYFYDGCPDNLSPLASYLKHLANADLMVYDMMKYLKKNHDDALFIWYGDHVAELPEIYEKLNFEGINTEYFIWSARNLKPQSQAVELPIENLSQKISDVLIG